MKILQGTNLGIRFILEMSSLVVLGYWGYETGEGATRWLLVILAPAGMIVLWGLFVAPKAAIRVARPLRLTVEFVIFGAAVLALDATGHRTPAIIFAIVALVSSTINAASD